MAAADGIIRPGWAKRRAYTAAMPTAEMADGPAQPLCVLSPHLDDAALSCGRLLAASVDPVVLTAFGGAPPDPDAPAHEWDLETTGCPTAGRAVTLRQGEDRAAARLLGASTVWAPWSEYHDPGPSAEVLTETLAGLLAGRGIRTVVLPLGIDHPHHVAVSEAALAACLADTTATRWFVYAETPYLGHNPEGAQGRLARFARDVTLTEVALPQSDAGRRVEAVDAFASQMPLLRTLRPHLDDDLRADERYWRITVGP
jgi:LmbE family N-acetylglucosaminyl deacetylase